MIGGVIIDVAYRGPAVRLWCVDPHDASGSHKISIHGECGVLISATGEIPGVGDSVWWQASHVYWTPKDKRFVDWPLLKIGAASSSSGMLYGETVDG